jgi:hypothetical protein
LKPALFEGSAVRSHCQFGVGWFGVLCNCCKYTVTKIMYRRIVRRKTKQKIKNLETHGSKA